MNPDPDPGGPKTCGSGGFGSATLIRWVSGIAWHRPGRRIWSGGPRYPDPDARPYPTAGTGLKKKEKSHRLIYTERSNPFSTTGGTRMQVVFWSGQCSGSATFWYGSGRGSGSSGPVPLTNGSGSGSCSFRQGPSRCYQNLFFSRFFIIAFWTYIILHRQKVTKKSQISIDQGFSYYFCLMRWSGSEPLTNGSESGRPNNLGILRFRIRPRNTADSIPTR